MISPEIHVWKVNDRTPPCEWFVAIGKDCYEMNANANMPNGVCIYLGSSADVIDGSYVACTSDDMIPVGTLRQVAKLVFAAAVEASERKFVIHNVQEPDLFWSNEDGWVDRKSATEFGSLHYNLPIDGSWLQVY